MHGLSIKFDPCLGPRLLINMSYENVPEWIKETLGHIKTQEMCNEVVHMEPCMLEEVPNCFKTRSMCEGAVEKIPSVLSHVPDYFKTPEMFIKAVEIDPWQLKYVPEDLIIQEMCNKAVGDCPWQLEHVPNQHKTREMCDRVVSRHNLCLLQNVPDLFGGVIQQRIKRRTLAYCLASWLCDGLVHAGRREEAVEATDISFLKLSDTKITAPWYILISPMVKA